MIIEPNKREACFIKAYFEAVYFTDTGDSEQPTVDQPLCEVFKRESVIDCLCFFGRYESYLSDDNLEQAGHDFWLTRNGHGTGFWDRPEVYGLTYANMFTDIAESFGEVDAYFDEVTS